jgi:uncharacterized protein (TIGR02284 family)
MKTNQEKIVDILNDLVVINNDRLEGYETAIKETDEADLKRLFTEMRSTSYECKQELLAAVSQLGGKPEEGTRPDGKLYRIWMDIKSALTNKDRKAILASCEFGEDFAVNTYEKALKNDDLTGSHQDMVRSQYLKIKADHDKVKHLRDAMVEA